MGLWNKPEVNLPSPSHHQQQYLLRSSSSQREEEQSDDVFHETLEEVGTTTNNEDEKQSLFNKRDPDALPWSLRAAPSDDEDTITNDGGELFAITESIIDETYERIMAFQNITLPHECFVAVIDGSLFSGKLVRGFVLTMLIYIVLHRKSNLLSILLCNLTYVHTLNSLLVMLL